MIKKLFLGILILVAAGLTVPAAADEPKCNDHCTATACQDSGKCCKEGGCHDGDCTKSCNPNCGTQPSCDNCPCQAATDQNGNHKISNSSFGIAIRLNSDDDHKSTVPFLSNLPYLEKLGYKVIRNGFVQKSGDDTCGPGKHKRFCILFDTNKDSRPPCHCQPAASPNQQSCRGSHTVEFAQGGKTGIDVDFTVDATPDHAFGCADFQSPPGKQHHSFASGSPGCHFCAHGCPVASPMIASPADCKTCVCIGDGLQEPARISPAMADEMGKLRTEIEVLKSREQICTYFMQQQEGLRHELFQARAEIVKLQAGQRIFQEREALLEQVAQLRSQNSELATQMDLQRLTAENELLRTRLMELTAQLRNDPNGRNARQALPQSQGR